MERLPQTPTVIFCEIIIIIIGYTTPSLMESNLTIRRYGSTDVEQVWSVHELAFRASPLEFFEVTKADYDLTGITRQYLDTDGEFLQLLL
jgi:hypothetical protein